MPTLDLNPQFQKALSAIERGKNVFITGKAGTGKSTLLKHFRDTTKRNVIVLAPTGVAAVNVQGQTIHSFFGFKPGITPDRVKKEYHGRDKDGLYKKIDTLVIKDQEVSSEFAVYITTTNDKVRMMNEIMLAKLQGKLYSFRGSVRGEFDEKAYPAPSVLDLKIDAQVMLTNNDREHRWVNGTVGKIKAFDEIENETVIWVELPEGETVDVMPYTWESYRTVLNKNTKHIETETVGTYTQFPIILAWAITVHKSQGKTFKEVIIDMDRGAFAHGKTYVALSRATSLEGIVLTTPIHKGHLRTDWRVMKFLTQFQYTKSQITLTTQMKLDVLRKAMALHQPIDIIYLKSSDEKSHRTIVPKRVGEMEYMEKTFLGVTAFDVMRNEERIFSVNRILEVRESESQ